MKTPLILIIWALIADCLWWLHPEWKAAQNIFEWIFPTILFIVFGWGFIEAIKQELYIEKGPLA